MKKYLVLAALLFASIVTFGQNTVEGLWTTIDDEDGQPSSITRVQIIDNKLTATIQELIGEPQDLLCKNCTDDKHNKPIVGMQFIYNMSKKGSSWSGGKILDPEDGNIYKCKIEMDGPNKLKVRGYIGIPAIGRTQVWERKLD